MPPLISEDVDEQASNRTGTATPVGEVLASVVLSDEHTQRGSRQTSKPTVDGPDAMAEPQGASLNSAQFTAPVTVPDDYDLGEQLQRSAEEGLSDPDIDALVESEDAVDPALLHVDAKEDITMTDADAEAEPDDEVAENDLASDAEITKEEPEPDAAGEAEEDNEEQNAREEVQETGGNDSPAGEEPEQAEEGSGAEAEAEEEGSDSEGSSDSADGEVESAGSGSKFATASGSASGPQSGSDSGDEDEEEGAEEDEAGSADCIFCKKSVAVDGEDAASSLACSECGRPAHIQCAQETEAVTGEDISEWQCPDCLKKTTASESPKERAARSKNSAPRLVRDLLPVTRGVQKPNSHSIFAQPLISEGEDGGRALRKRKSPTQEPVPVEKRRRKATERASAVATSSAAMSVDSTSTSTAMSTRRSSQMKTSKPTTRILQHRPFNKPPPHKFILAFRLDQPKIEGILSKPPRPGRRRDRKVQQKKKEQKIPPPIYQPPVPKFPALPTHNLIFPSAFTDREAELNAKPYGGILSEADADTSRSLPQLKDREIFEIARKEAEEERRRTSAAAEAEISGGADAAAATPAATSSTTKPNRSTVSGPPSKIKCIQFGKHVIDTFYAAPYPEEYSHESRLFICEFCLKYLPSEFVAYRHKLKCPAKHPPGDEIYRDGTVSVWEVDGRKKTEYCQCLCLMAKMFLGSKTLYYDVEPFLFYILTEYDELGYHFVGYFSKEKRPASQNNVSCILVMPIHQRKGYAMFLIDFSYLLTRIEKKEGSPEKPLSDMGLTAYRSYWDLTISRHLLALVESKTPFSTKTLMGRTGMTADDVIHSLERLYAFIKDPVTKTYAIRFDQKLYERIVDDFERKGHRRLKPELLIWTPYVMGRSDREALDGKGPLNALAPRSDDEGEEEEEAEVVGDVDDDSQAVASKAEKSVVGDAEVVNTELDREQLSPMAEPESEKVGSRSASVGGQAEDTANVKDPALVDVLGHVAPGPPSTDAFNAAVSTQAPHSEVKLNGLTNGTPTKSQEILIDPQLQDTINKEHPTQAQPGEKYTATQSPIKLTEDRQKPPSPPLRGYALAFREHGIPPSRFQIDPPIPPSMLRRQGTKKRTASTAFGTPSTHRRNGAVGPGKEFIGSAANAVVVRSSPRHNARSSAGLGASIAGLDGTGSASPKVPGTPVRRSGRRSGLVNVVSTVDGSVEDNAEEDEEEDAPAEEDDEVPGKDDEEDDEEASSADDDEEEEDDDDDEEPQTSVAAGSDGTVEGVEGEEDEDEDSDEAEVEVEDEDDEEVEEEDSADDDPNDPDAVPDEQDESEDSEEDDEDPDPDGEIDDDAEEDAESDGDVDGDGDGDDGDEDAEAEDDD